MKTRLLEVSINHDLIGNLTEENGWWAFQYSDQWLNNQHHFNISPFLPVQKDKIIDTGSVRPVQWYFDNLLPEEGQRILLAKDAQIDAADAFGLLAYYGAESAGSLVLKNPLSNEHDFVDEQIHSIYKLTDEDLFERIQLMPNVPLMHHAHKRMSLAGAQHKLAVVFKENIIYEPSGNTASTQILKPNHPDDDYPHSVINEYFTMRLARELGLDVPNVYRRYTPAPIYLIDRFDRKTNKEQVVRVHALDACQLLGLDKRFKYVVGSIEKLAEFASLCRNPGLTKTKLLKWMIFNILVGNSDAHLKNLSFIVKNKGYELAPHYDLLSTASYDSLAYEKTVWPQATILAWPVLGVRRFEEINHQKIIEIGKCLGLSAIATHRTLDQIIEKIQTAAQKIYTEIEQENQQLALERPQLNASFAGELKCLRIIRYNVIDYMLAKLKN